MSADAPVALPSMGFRGGLLKAAVVVPDLIISTLIGFVLLAASPADVAVGFLTVLLLVSLVIASGCAEGVAVRILYAAHQPIAREARHLAGPLRLVVNRSGRDDLRILFGGGGEAVSAAGRNHVILHRGIVDALIAGRISDAEAAALIAHGVGRLRLGQPRLDLLATLWTLPWDFLRGLFAGIGQRLSWVPLGRFAWQTRFVVGTIAVVLETQAGRWPSPIVIALFLALSYLMPLQRQAWQREQREAADHHAAELGFAEPLVRFLRRLPRDADLEGRLDPLVAPTRHPSPPLPVR
ncbi:hypothetical protein [Propioniciclava tarda]|uniref:Uncharacterized protein n=1 Tax=Propioniciclava tarda TaxID=433330 RepID=A0A4Q9KN03_PROTD|nr:hypothetical protein [Propioniciclava tarda]TBT95913.1 hypothetical protein ET996_02765 [Propioniciclava tarda]SMO41370.1 hypothetical protein SAMN06266982_102170 [Propioniciclava tarda]